MSRLLSIVGLALLGMAGTAGVLGYFAYGNEPARSGWLTLDGLQQPAAIQWSEDGSVAIEAGGEADLFAALGYVHGTDHAWAMTLWKQAALGHLSQWFGSGYVDYDRHARHLGFGDLAQQTYDALPAEEKTLLDAYAAGANRALASASVVQQDEFVLLDLEPEPWLPWHALAVERMMAWMGTPAIAADSSFSALARADSALIRFASADSLFRALLHLGGASQSRAWTARIGSATLAAQQLAYGNSALPLIREVTFRFGSVESLAATVPGTLMLPAGQSDNRIWCVFLTSPQSLIPADSLPPPPRFDRLIDREGNETLLTFPRSAQGLYLKAAPLAPTPTAVPAVRDSLGETAVDRDAVPSDSLRLALRAPASAPLLKAPPAWLVKWPGFDRGSDLNAWRALLNGSQPFPFALFRGDGLITSSSGEATALGSPPFQRAIPGGLFVAAGPVARFAADRLEMLLVSADSTAELSDALMMDTYSPWAASLTPHLIAQLGHRDSLDVSIKDAYAFLRGWDYRFDQGSIAASIFEEWLTTYYDKFASLPTAVADSNVTVALRETLRDAVSQLGAKHGEGASAWRWELVQPGARFFPVWSQTSRGAPPARYEPLKPGFGGHPTTLLLGPSRVFGDHPIPAVWTAWTLTSSWDRMRIYHPVAPTTGFSARGLALDEPLPAYTVRRDVTFSDPLYLRPRE